MLNVELEEKLKLIDLSIDIQRSDFPRITAMLVLPTVRMRILYLINDIGAEIGAFLATVVWAVSLTIPESFLVVLPTYQALLSEGSPYFWAACWWIIAAIKLGAVVTGNVYIRRFSFLMGLIAWTATTVVLVGEYRTYNVLVGFASTFAIVSWWNYIKAGLMLQQHIEYVDDVITHRAVGE